MAPIAGTLWFSIDGVPYSTTGSFTVSPSDRENEALVGHDGSVSTIERPIAPGISGTIVIKPGVSLAALQGLDGGTVTANLKQGRVYDLYGAYVTGKIDHDAAEGTAQVELFGSKCVER
jgi:hypothetical protein